MDTKPGRNELEGRGAPSSVNGSTYLPNVIKLELSPIFVTAVI